MGLKLLCKETESANTMTVVYYPNGVDDVRFRKSMAESGIVVAGGLGPLKGKTFRVGHMGNIDKNDLLATISAIEGALSDRITVLLKGQAWQPLIDYCRTIYSD